VANQFFSRGSGLVMNHLSLLVRVGQFEVWLVSFGPIVLWGV